MAEQANIKTGEEGAKPSANPVKSITRIISHFEGLKKQRRPLESVRAECYKYTFPLRGSGTDGFEKDASQTLGEVSELLTTEGTRAVRDVASIIVGGMTPSNALWFNLAAEGLSEEDNNALNRASDIIFRKIHASNFDSEAVESMLDNLIAGQSVVYITDNDTHDGYVFEQWNLANTYTATTRRDGLIDIVYRHYKLTAEQAVSEFGLDNVSDRIKTAYHTTPSEKFEFLHYIAPRDSYRRGSPFKKDLPFMSCHIDLDANVMVRESGYHEFPVTSPRWSREKDSPEGVGLVYDALPAIKELNVLKDLEKIGVAISAAGMYVATDDGVLNPANLRIGPGEVVVASSLDSIKPLGTANNFNVAFSSEDRLVSEIRAIMMADQLPPVNSGVRTATEFQVRLQYLRQLLGPVFGRLNSEWLGVLVNRCFGIAVRNGWVEIPESLADKPYTVRYISPLAQAQRENEVAALERFVQQTAGVAQVNPNVLDVVDSDEIIRQMGNKQNLVDILRNPKDVEEIRTQRAKAQQEQQQQAMQQQMAMSVAEQKIKGG